MPKWDQFMQEETRRSLEQMRQEENLDGQRHVSVHSLKFLCANVIKQRIIEGKGIDPEEALAVSGQLFH